MTAHKAKALSIQVHLNGLSFCILNNDYNKVEYLEAVNFEQKLTPFDVLNRLKAHLSTHTLFSNNFDAVQIIHQNELATIVPRALYDDKHKADYLKFNSKILKTDLVAKDELQANDNVNVYVPYVNINNYIFENFGEFVFKHASTVLIDSFLKQKRNVEADYMYINVNSNNFELVVVRDNKLQLYNCFGYNTKEDFIYYVLFVFEQLALDTETTIVNLCGLIDENDALYNILYTYIRHVEFTDCTFAFESSESITEKLHHHYLILNSF